MNKNSEKTYISDESNSQNHTSHTGVVNLIGKIHTESVRTNGGRIIKFEPTLILDYLQKKGFRTHNKELIKVIDNVATVATREDIFKFLLEYVKSFKDDELTNAFFKDGESLILKKDGLLLGIKEAGKEPLKDTKTKCFIAYKNGVVKISNGKIELLKYSNLNVFVWYEHIIKRDFNYINDYYNNRNVYDKCLINSTNNKPHYNSAISALGNLIHGHKDQRLTKAIIVNDENLEEESEAGGSGKGLLVKAVSHIRPVLVINGKNADPINNRFFLQGVTPRTSIILIDDPPRNVHFEAYFSYLTEGMTVEKKHKSVNVIAFKDSPKFVFTTNYTIKGDSSSHKRRRFDIFLNSFYNSEHSPSDDFGHEFFFDWDNNEWNKFDYFIAKCVQVFLKKGLVPYDNHELKLKKLKNETSADFYELMESSYNDSKEHSYSEIRSRLVAEYGSKYEFHNRSHKVTVEWVRRYAEFKGYKLDKKQKRLGFVYEFIFNSEGNEDI